MKQIYKRVLSLILLVTMFLGMIPEWSAEALASEVKKAYEIVLEPTMVYEEVYGFYNGVSPVSKKDSDGTELWGAIDINGQEIISCKYKDKSIFDDMSGILVWTKENRVQKINFKGEIIKDFGEFSNVTFFVSDKNWILFSGNDCFNFINIHSNQCIKEIKNYNFDDEKMVCATDYSGVPYRVYSSKTGNYLNELPTGIDIWDYFLFYRGYVNRNVCDEDDYYLYTELLKTDGTVCFKTDQFDTISYCTENELLAEDFEGNYYLLDYAGKILNELKFEENGYQFDEYGDGIIDSEHIIVQDDEGIWYMVDSDMKIIYNYGKCSHLQNIGEGLLEKRTYDDKQDYVEIIKYDGTSVIPKSSNLIRWFSGEFMSHENDILCWYDRDGKQILKKNVSNNIDLSVLGNSEMRIWLGSSVSNETRDITLYSGDDFSVICTGMENIGNYHDGYLPVKIKGKWGVYKFTDNKIPGNNKVSDKPIISIKESKSIIAPATVKISKVKTLKKKVSLTFKKAKGIRGYLIQYSTKKNFKGAKKKYTTKTKFTIKKLQSKKRYYFRIKAYKLNGKKKVYSKKWSKVKTVRVK